MKIDGIELRLLSLPMREAFGAAHGTVKRREITVLRISTDEGHGWGECAALPEPTYSGETAAGAFDVLAGALLPRIMHRRLAAAGALDCLAGVGGNVLSKAAIEMALLDVALRSCGRSLAAWLADRTELATTVPAGAVVGLGPPAEVANRVAQLAAEGFGRVKIKIMPGNDRQVLTAVRAECPDLDLHADGNGSYRATDLPLLASLGDEGLSTLEQPFPPGRPEWAAELLSATDGAGLTVVADEAAVDLAAVQDLHRRRALHAVAVKPSRLGGLAAARDLHDWCRGAGLGMTAGGMVETGLGRHALAALAALPGFTITGDVSPAKRWLASDPWPDLVMADGQIEVPSTPGIAPDPDPDLLARHTLRQTDL